MLVKMNEYHQKRKESNLRKSALMSESFLLKSLVKSHKLQLEDTETQKQSARERLTQIEKGQGIPLTPTSTRSLLTWVKEEKPAKAAYSQKISWNPYQGNHSQTSSSNTYNSVSGTPTSSPESKRMQALPYLVSPTPSIRRKDTPRLTISEVGKKRNRDDNNHDVLNKIYDNAGDELPDVDDI